MWTDFGFFGMRAESLPKNELISEVIYWFYLIRTPPNVREIIRFRLISAHSISWFHTIHKFIHEFFVYIFLRGDSRFRSSAFVVGVRSEKEWRIVERKSNKTHNNSQKFKAKKRARLSDGFFLLILAPKKKTRIQNFFIRSASNDSVKWFTRTLWMSGFDIFTPKNSRKPSDGIAAYKINYNAMR